MGRIAGVEPGIDCGLSLGALPDAGSSLARRRRGGGALGGFESGNGGGDSLEGLLAVAGYDQDVPLMIVQLRHFGGALVRATAADGPLGAVTEPYQLFALGVPMAPGMAEGIEATFAALSAAVAGSASDRIMPTFNGASIDPTRSYRPDTIERLRAIKQAADPDRVLRGNRPLV